MIVNNLHVTCTPVLLYEANPPLIIDSNAVLPAPIAFKLRQTIRWWNSQVVNDGGCIKHSKLKPGALLNFRR